MAGPLSRIELFCCSKNSSNPFSKEWCGLSSEKVLGWPRSLFGFSHTIWMDFLANQICSCPHSRLGFPGGSVNKYACNAGDLRKIPWRREWLPTPVFLPGELHSQRSLAGYSPWGLKESDMTHDWATFFECSTLTASTFRILNSSTGIPSPPFAYFTLQDVQL